MTVKQWTPDGLFALSAQTQAACALFAAVELNLFTILDEAPEKSLPVDELAHKLKCQPRALDMLFTYLAADGFLERDGLAVALTTNSKKYLSTHSDEYFGFIIKHLKHLLPAWSQLTEALKTGKSVVGSEPSDSEREAFLMGMFNVASNQADQVAQALDLSSGNNLLDLGGGPGAYAIYFCRHYPQLKATIFDLPSTAPFAKNMIERFKMSSRVNFTSGDFITDELPSGFDIVWLSQILHGEAPHNAAKLVQKAVNALNPGGTVAIQEFIINDDRQGPVFPALFSLNMLLQTEGGQAYTQTEITSMMVEAGLKNICRLDINLPSGCGFLKGEKI